MSSAAIARLFDLNIEKILEGWEVCHATRELIANALDEESLSGTKDISITRLFRRNVEDSRLRSRHSI